ncbi:MAG: DNA mismatch endonuclease Vsr, partial [Nitrosopumilus sp.]
MDIWTKKKRSEVMSKIRSKNTKPEKLMRSLLHKAGYRYSLHKSELPGNPDIVLSKYRTVIFVNGCFWHNHKNCREGRIPSSNSIYWKEKLDKNVTRDLRHHEVLRKKGWQVIFV